MKSVPFHEAFSPTPSSTVAAVFQRTSRHLTPSWRRCHPNSASPGSAHEDFFSYGQLRTWFAHSVRKCSVCPLIAPSFHHRPQDGTDGIRVASQGPDQTDATSTAPAAMADAQSWMCWLSKMNTPTGIKSTMTVVTVSYTFLRAKNITNPRALPPGKQRNTERNYLGYPGQAKSTDSSNDPTNSSFRLERSSKQR